MLLGYYIEPEKEKEEFFQGQSIMTTMKVGTAGRKFLGGSKKEGGEVGSTLITTLKVNKAKNEFKDLVKGNLFSKEYPLCALKDSLEFNFF